jgi:hypothetical protein
MTVRELLARMDSHEIAEWQAYASIWPLPVDRGDIQTGIMASTNANCHRAEGTVAFKPADFMPDWTKEKAEADEQEAIAFQVQGAFNSIRQQMRQ